MAEVINELGLEPSVQKEIFGVRHYEKDGQMGPSVTTVLSRVMGPNLTNWYARMAARRAFDLASHRPTVAFADELKAWEKEAIEDASEAARREADWHAIVGELFHEAMWTGELDPILTEPLPHKFRKMIDTLIYNWSKILEEWQIYPVLTEFPILATSPSGLIYGGTLDALVEDINGHRILLEVKTGRNVEYSHALQCAAYGDALKQMDVGYNEAFVIRVDKYMDHRFDYRPVNEELCVNLFDDCLRIYHIGEQVWGEDL